MMGFQLLLKLFFGIILIFLIGGVAGHLFKLDRYYKEMWKSKNDDLGLVENEDDNDYDTLNL